MLLVVEYRVTASGKCHILLHPPFQGKPISVCGALHGFKHNPDRDHLLICFLCKEAVETCSDYIELKKDSALCISPASEEFAQVGIEEKEAILTYRHQIKVFTIQWVSFCVSHEIPINTDSPWEIDIVILEG